MGSRGNPFVREETSTFAEERDSFWRLELLHVEDETQGRSSESQENLRALRDSMIVSSSVTYEFEVIRSGECFSQSSERLKKLSKLDVHLIAVVPTCHLLQMAFKALTA